MRLSRGRPCTALGSPLPIPYRDLRDELQACSWPDKAQAERWITALDDEFMRLAERQTKS